MKCYIVKDLLPNYIDGLTGRETAEDVKKHLEDCEDCRTVYGQMSAAIPPETPPEQKNIDFLKKLRTAARRKYARTAILACILLTVLLAGFTIFAINYDIPIPYDPDHMSAEIYQAALITNHNGFFHWTDLDQLNFEDKKEVLAGNYKTIDMIRLTCRGIDRTCRIPSESRVIYRNGEKIRVIYYCSTKTLWDILFFKDNGHPGNGWTSGGDIYGGSDYQETYEPEMREIYYLPMRNMDRLGKLSDEEFDALREKATLVWSGVI